MIKKIVFIILLTIIALYNITLFYVDKNIQNKELTNIYSSCHKIWSSRGFYETKDEQNSIKSFTKAFDLGAKGAEVDFYYDSKMNRFIISHDRPKKASDGTLLYTQKNNELLTLEKLFKTFAKDKYFWLDYKNLDRISEEETDKAIKRLLKITKNDSIRERLYIEGSNPFILSRYTDVGFQTILAVRPLPHNNFLSTISSNLFKILYYFNNITALTMPYGDVANPFYGEKTQNALQDIPVFLFHVNEDEKLLKSLVEKDDVKVILAGRDKSLNRFYINDCK